SSPSRRWRVRRESVKSRWRYRGVRTRQVGVEIGTAAPAAAARRYLIWLDAAFLLLSPVAAWAILQINLINQAGYLDPWLYTGYGQVFEQLVQTYGWRYYALRFPVIFLNSLCCAGDAPVVGYALLRYGLFLVAGVPLYLL